MDNSFNDKDFTRAITLEKYRQLAKQADRETLEQMFVLAMQNFLSAQDIAKDLLVKDIVGDTFDVR